MPLARCHICRALLNDEPEDRRDHIAWHKSLDKSFTAFRTQANDVKIAVAGLRDDVKSYGRQLDEQPIPEVPEPTIVDIDPDEYDTDADVQDALDEDEVSLDHPAAGEPAEHPTDDDAVVVSPNPAMAYFHPAQVDDLDARIARQTGAIG